MEGAVVAVEFGRNVQCSMTHDTAQPFPRRCKETTDGRKGGAAVLWEEGQETTLIYVSSSNSFPCPSAAQTPAKRIQCSLDAE